MRKLLLGSVAALTMAGQMAQAGGLAEPIMEAEVVEAATSSSAAGIVVPLLLLLLIVAAATSSSSGGGSEIPL